MAQSVQSVTKRAKVVLIVIVLLVLATGIWLLWQYVTKRVVANSYQTCVAAGNPVLDSYPSVCIDASGQRFTNPHEQILER